MAENGDNEKMAALEAKICHQIEYYFGDFNLPRDKFLKEQIKLDEGWVPLEIMIKFNRLNRLTTDFNVIVEALSKSKAELMEISEDKTKIRRSPSKPLPEVTDEYKNDVKNRSVYIKGFPTDATLDDIKEWLEDKGQVLNIQMRRTLQEDYFAKKNEERKQNKVEAKLRAKQEQEEKQKLEEDAEMKSLEEKIGCLLKFSGDLDDQTCREDLHVLFSSHGEIKLHLIDITKAPKELQMELTELSVDDTLKSLFGAEKDPIEIWKNAEKAKEALDKAKDANNGNLQLRNKEVTWEVLEGEVEKEALKKIIEDQQESLNKWKSKGRRFKGKGKGNKAAQPGSAKGKVQFQGKKTKFASDDERDENGATGPVKRAREETDKEEPASKQQKTENGAGDQ
ncbi:PREDICTED: lupus La protein [Propithecus coquereli]|uniref:lupus La protein n=1 Tax=Propithecus coquereli TaxID=379532 RepID=UPI00063EE6F1|nr:PREDICTED: lupus La protein [Propithecus coquereli]